MRELVGEVGEIALDAAASPVSGLAGSVVIKESVRLVAGVTDGVSSALKTVSAGSSAGASSPRNSDSSRLVPTRSKSDSSMEVPVSPGVDDGGAALAADAYSAMRKRSQSAGVLPARGAAAVGSRLTAGWLERSGDGSEEQAAHRGGRQQQQVAVQQQPEPEPELEPEAQQGADPWDVA